MLSNTSRAKYKHFRHGLLQTPRRSFKRQQLQKLLLNGSQNSYGYRYGKYKPGNPVKQIEVSLCSSSGRSKVPYIKSLSCTRKIPNVQLAGKLKKFIENWKILTNGT